MLLFNGLLCAAGEQVGCDAVRDSQDTSDQWWRSPGILIEHVDTAAEPNLNSDQVLGLLLYVLERHDGDRFRKWLEWVRSKGSPKRFCSLEGGDVGQCVFRPTDCALILLVGATVGEQTAALSLCPPADVLGLFSPVGYVPRIEDAFRLYDGAVALYNKNLGLVQDLQKQLNLDAVASNSGSSSYAGSGKTGLR